jgi:hypothetical protein
LLFEYGTVHLTIHPCGKPQGILAKANKFKVILLIGKKYFPDQGAGPLQI